MIARNVSFLIFVIALALMPACSKLPGNLEDVTVDEDPETGAEVAGFKVYARGLSDEDFEDGKQGCFLFDTYFGPDDETLGWREDECNSHCMDMADFRDNGLALRAPVTQPMHFSMQIQEIVNGKARHLKTITSGLAVGTTPLRCLVGTPAGIAFKFQVRTDASIYQDCQNTDKVVQQPVFYQFCTTPGGQGCFDPEKAYISLVGSVNGYRPHRGVFNSSEGPMTSYRFEDIDLLLDAENWIWVLVQKWGLDGQPSTDDDVWERRLWDVYVRNITPDTHLTNVEAVGTLEEGFPTQCSVVRGAREALVFTYRSGNQVDNGGGNDAPTSVEVLFRQSLAEPDEENWVGAEEGLAFSTTLPVPGGDTVRYQDYTCFDEDEREFLAGDCYRSWALAESGEYVLNVWSDRGQHLNGILVRVGDGDWKFLTCVIDFNEGTDDPPHLSYMFSVSNRALEQCENSEQEIIIQPE